MLVFVAIPDVGEVLSLIPWVGRSTRLLGPCLSLAFLGFSHYCLFLSSRWRVLGSVAQVHVLWPDAEVTEKDGQSDLDSLPQFSSLCSSLGLTQTLSGITCPLVL